MSQTEKMQGVKMNKIAILDRFDLVISPKYGEPEVYDGFDWKESLQFSGQIRIIIPSITYFS